MSSFFLDLGSAGFLPKHIIAGAMQRAQEKSGSSSWAAEEVLRSTKYGLHACSSIEAWERGPLLDVEPGSDVQLSQRRAVPEAGGVEREC
jgi:hypothetical protein